MVKVERVYNVSTISSWPFQTPDLQTCGGHPFQTLISWGYENWRKNGLNSSRHVGGHPFQTLISWGYENWSLGKMDSIHRGTLALPLPRLKANQNQNRWPCCHLAPGCPCFDPQAVEGCMQKTPSNMKSNLLQLERLMQDLSLTSLRIKTVILYPMRS